MITVAQLIDKLQTLPQELSVVRGDVDWGWVSVKDVEVVDAQEGEDGCGWVEYFPEVSEEKLFKAVKIS